MRKLSRGVASLTIAALIMAGSAWAAPKVDITKDVVYGHKDGMALTYDVVQPKKDIGAAVIFMVSGGWFSRYAPPQAAVGMFPEILDAGYTMYLVRHGSAPRYKVPEAVADVQKAIDHIYENAGDHGVDPNRLGVFGGSAGGHLSLMLGCATGPVGEAPDDKAKSREGRVAAVAAYFPPVDLTEIVGPNDRFPALDFAQEDAKYVSPIFHVTPDDAPTILIHGDADELVPLSHSVDIHAKFEEAKVPVEFITIEGAGHGFQGEDGKRAINAVVAWFDKHLAE